jgi:hypothetical protein
MPWIQQSSPPPNQIHSFSLQNYAGGMNNRSRMLQDNESPHVLNMMFTDQEVLERRPGTKKYDEVHLGEPVTWMDEYRPFDETDQLIRATDTKIYADGAQIATTGWRITGVNYQGKYIYTDGGNVRVYGKFPQASIGEYVEVRGTPDAGYTVFRVASPPSGFTPLPEPHREGKTVYDYATKTLWYEPCDYEVKDTSRGSNVVPTNTDYLVSHKGRIFVSHDERADDTVYLSEIGNPYYFPVYASVQLPPTNDRVYGLEVFDDAVVIGRHEDIYLLRGETNDPNLGLPLHKLEKVNSHTGVLGARSLNVVNNYLFFLGSDGVVYGMSSAYTNGYLATEIISKQVDLFKEPINLTFSDLRNSSTYYDDEHWYLNAGGKTLVYSYRHRSWLMWKGLNARTMFRLGDELIWGTWTGGTHTFDKASYTDLGKPFKSTWESKYFDMGQASTYKQFREFYIVAHTFDDFPSDIRFRFEVDYADVNAEVIVKNQTSRWGLSLFGDRFITRNVNSSSPIVIGRRGRLIRFLANVGFEVAHTKTNASELETIPGKVDNLCAYVTSEDTYYVYSKGAWIPLVESDYNQAMRIYQINGDYEFRGKR